jgi:outer membrane receptor protein involved in Fe transport
MTLGTVPPVQHDTRSAELWAQHALELFEGNRLTVGASARVIHHLPGTMVDCGDVDRAAFDPDACVPIELFETRLGAYVQDEWQVHESVTLTGGLRFDWSSLNPDPGISPRVAAVWSFLPQQALRVSYGRAYRYPNFLESHGHVLMTPDPDAPPDLVRAVQYLFAVGGGNTALDNQTVDSVEAGWRGRFLDGSLVSTVDVFALAIQNRFHLDGLEDIELVQGFGGAPTLPPDVLPLYGNREEPVLAAGGEATLTYRPNRRLRLSGHYALNYVIQDDDIWQLEDGGLREPRHRVVAYGRFEVIEGLAAGLDLHWSSAYLSRSLDPTSILLSPLADTLGGQPIVMGSLRYRRPVGEQTFEVGLSGYNLLDRPVQEQSAAEVLSRRLRIFVSVRPAAG